MVRRRLLLALLFMLVNGLSAAQPHAPVVTMSVTLPDGRTQELTAPESGLATLQLKDGSEYGFRPTIQDSSPWNRIVVTIFRTASQCPDYGPRGARGDERRSCRRVQDDTFVQSVRLSSITACD